VIVPQSNRNVPNAMYIVDRMATQGDALGYGVGWPSANKWSIVSRTDREWSQFSVVYPA